MRRRRSTGGFSLVESEIACLIFMIVAVGFSYAYLANIKTQKMSITHFRANCLARNRIQRGTTMDYSSLWAMAETNVMVTVDGFVSTTGTYKRTTIVDTGYMSNCTRIVVQIWYPTPNGRLSSEPMEVSTIFAEPMME